MGPNPNENPGTSKLLLLELLDTQVFVGVPSVAPTVGDFFGNLDSETTFF